MEWIDLGVVVVAVTVAICPNFLRPPLGDRKIGSCRDPCAR